jgi:hypothetical protein
MRTYLVAFTFLFAINGFSCTKEKTDTTKVHNLPGLWIGTATTDQFPQQAPLYYSFIIKPDGTLLTEGKVSNGNTYYSRGTWTLNRDTLRCTYTTINFPNVTVTQSAKFVYNSSAGTLQSGTWRDEQNGSNYTGAFQNMVEVD